MKIKEVENQCQEETLKEETKKLSVKEAAVASVMDGAGSRYMTPYALALGASNSQIGLLTSFPSLFGNLSQIFSSKIMEKHSRKKIIMLGAFLQALMWLPLIVVGYFFFYKNLSANMSSNLVIFIWTLLVISGAFLSPSWNSLMKDTVTKDIGKYFGKRNRIAGVISLGVMLIAGFILNYFKQKELFI